MNSSLQVFRKKVVIPNKEDRERIAVELAENDGKYKRGKGSQKQAAD